MKKMLNDYRLIYLIGAGILVLTLIFWVGETWYFGWNLKPQSLEELVCDMAVNVFIMIGLLLVVYSYIFRPIAPTSIVFNGLTDGQFFELRDSIKDLADGRGK